MCLCKGNRKLEMSLEVTGTEIFNDTSPRLIMQTTQPTGPQALVTPALRFQKWMDSSWDLGQSQQRGWALSANPS